jgi:hypothetical protein
LEKKNYFVFWRYITSGKKRGMANSGHLKENKTKSMNLNPKKVIQDPKKRGVGAKEKHGICKLSTLILDHKIGGYHHKMWRIVGI